MLLSIGQMILILKSNEKLFSPAEREFIDVVYVKSNKGKNTPLLSGEEVDEVDDLFTALEPR